MEDDLLIFSLVVFFGSNVTFRGCIRFQKTKGLSAVDKRFHDDPKLPIDPSSMKYVFTHNHCSNSDVKTRWQF